MVSAPRDACSADHSPLDSAKGGPLTDRDGWLALRFTPALTRRDMRALVDAGYTGYVGQEFIPTRDPHQGLKEAFELCDV